MITCVQTKSTRRVMASKKKLKRAIKEIKRDSKEVMSSYENGEFDESKFTYGQGINIQASITLGILDLHGF
jgi:hypothetical protein